MDMQECCELLLRIEQEIDVNDMFYEGEHLWPLVRHCLWGLCSKGCQPVCSASKIQPMLLKEVSLQQSPTIMDHLDHIVNRIIIPRFSRSLKVAQQSSTLSGISADIYFLSQPIYYSESLHKKPYSRIVDPVFETLCPFFKCLKLEELPKGESPPPREYPCQFIDLIPLKTSVSNVVLETLNLYNKILLDISCVAGVEHRELTRSLSSNLQTAIKYRDTFSLLFKKLKPKLFFLASYYFPRFMGINWAASMANIPTVDLQHGKQGKFQEMYTHWTKIPDEGYAMLPTWFWSWGQPSVENIMKWQVNRKVHKSILGGYPWMTRWKDKEFSQVQIKWPDAKKVILISTQAPVGGFDDFFPDLLVDAIQQSPTNWSWIIREHPNYKQGNILIREKLRDINDERYVIDTYNNVPLYNLLSECDFHITASSSVCYEAEAFSVPTAIFSEVGRKMYAQEIKAGNFIYCDDGKSLVQAISQFKMKKNNVRYIESDAKLVFSALQTVVKGSGLNKIVIPDTQLETVSPKTTTGF